MNRAPILLLLALAACTPDPKPSPAQPTSATTPTAATPPTTPSSGAPIYGIEAKTIDGETVKLDRYAGKVLLVVNVASQCGYTPQYTGLEALYEKHKAEGLEVLAFPCDQFGNQEPGSESEIKSFCLTKYGVKFPLFSKVEVNGPNTTALYKHLKSEKPGDVKWNFTKFLVGRDGRVVQRFDSKVTPEALEPEVVALLAQK